MTPRRYKLVAALALVALTLLLHLRSRHTADVAWVQRLPPANSLALGHAEGALFLMAYTPYEPTSPRDVGANTHSFELHRPAWRRILGRQVSGAPPRSRFALVSVESAAPWRTSNPSLGPAYYSIRANARTFYIRFWCVEAAFSLLALYWLLRELQYQCARRAAGHAICYHCGYDLRASPDRCPECGRPTPPAPATPSSTR